MGVVLIEQFPSFSKLDIELRSEILDITDRLPSYSDFNFTSLISWDVHDDLAVSRLGGNLVCRFSDYLNGELFLSFIGIDESETAAHTLLDYAEDSQLPIRDLRLVPDLCVSEFSGDSLLVVEDPDNQDYVVSTLGLAALDGAGFKNVRRSLSVFSRDQPEPEYVAIDVAGQSNTGKIEEIFDIREGDKACDSTNELLALRRILSRAKELSIESRGVMLDGKLKAFILFERLSHEVAMGHFWKADTRHTGIYHFLMHQLSMELSSQGIYELNIQQDLGLEGLRRAKNFLCPVSHLKKFTVSRAATHQSAQVNKREKPVR